MVLRISYIYDVVLLHDGTTVGGIVGSDRTLGSAIKVTRGVEHKHGILLQVVFSGSAIPCYHEYDKPNSRGYR